MHYKPLAIIVGGTAGIGYAVAKEIALNYSLALIYRSDVERANKAKAELETLGASNVDVFQENIVDLDSASRVYKKIRDRFGLGAEILINCAGYTKMNLFMNTEYQDFVATFQDHYFGVIAITRLAVEDMYSQKKGRVINMSSIATFCNHKGMVAYASAKSAIETFTKCLSLELYHRNITVNSIQPGVTKESLQDKDLKFQNSIPALHIAKMVCFLISDAGASVTGSNFLIDAGLHNLELPQI